MKEINLDEINNKNIPLNYMIPFQGRMNKGVFDCMYCDSKALHRKSKYCVVEDIIGFSDSPWGKMIVWKCKDCGKIQFFHLRENESYNLDYVKLYHEYITTGIYH